MANGDDAVAAGMDVVPSTADRRQGYDEINKTRDYIARRTNAITPVAKGGTGATDAAAARTNLGAAGRNSFGQPLAVAQIPASGAGDIGVYYNVAAGRCVFRVAGVGTDMGVATSAEFDTVSAAAAAALASADGRVAKGGDTMTGNLMLPNSTAATSSFTVCYINGDGRVSRGSSARKYKKYISNVDPLSLGDIFPQLVRYQMRSGDGDWKLGHIADDLDGDNARFAVFINDEIESIDFIQLLLAQTAQLNARLTALEAAHGDTN